MRPGATRNARLRFIAVKGLSNGGSEVICCSPGFENPAGKQFGDAKPMCRESSRSFCSPSLPLLTRAWQTRGC